MTIFDPNSIVKERAFNPNDIVTPEQTSINAAVSQDEQLKQEKAQFNQEANAIPNAIGKFIGGAGNVALDTLNQTFIQPHLDLAKSARETVNDRNEMAFQLNKINKMNIPEEQKHQQVDMLMASYNEKMKQDRLANTSAVLRVAAPYVGGIPKTLGVKALAMAGLPSSTAIGLAAYADALKDGDSKPQAIGEGLTSFGVAEASSIGLPKVLNFGKGFYKTVLGNSKQVLQKAENIGTKALTFWNKNEMGPQAFKDTMESPKVFFPPETPLYSSVSTKQKMAGVEDNSISARFIKTISDTRDRVGKLVGQLKEQAVKNNEGVYVNVSSLLNDIDNTFMTKTGGDVGVKWGLKTEVHPVTTRFNERTGLFSETPITTGLREKTVGYTKPTKEAKAMTGLSAEIFAKARHTNEDVYNHGNHNEVIIAFDDLYNAVNAYEKRFNSEVMKRVTAGDTRGKPQLTEVETMMYRTIQKAKDLVSQHIDNNVTGLDRAKNAYKMLSTDLTTLGPINDYKPTEMASVIKSMHKPEYSDEYNALRDLIPKSDFLLGLAHSLNRPAKTKVELAQSLNRYGALRNTGFIGEKILEKAYAASKQVPDYAVSKGDQKIINFVKGLTNVTNTTKTVGKRAQMGINANFGGSLLNVIERQVNSNR